MEDPKIQVAFRLPASLRRRLKKAAADQERPMGAIVTEAIEAAVELHEEQVAAAA